MKQIKKLIALGIVLLYLFSNKNVLSVHASVSLTSTQIANYFNSQEGKSWANDACLNFVRTCFQNMGGEFSSSCCAYNYGNSHIQSDDINSIPVGADVFFDKSSSTCSTCGNNAGHIGVYVGNGYFVHATGGKVQKSLVSDWSSRFRGWGYHGGITVVPDPIPDDDYVYHLDLPGSGPYSGSNNIEVTGWLASNKDISYAFYEIENVAGSQNTMGIADDQDVKNANAGYAYGKRFRGVIDINLLSSNSTYTLKVWLGFADGSQTEVKTSTFSTGTLTNVSVPTGSNVRIVSQSTTEYTVAVNFTGTVDSIKFPTWTVANDQDDIKWPEGTISGNEARCTINIADHNNEQNVVYVTHIYAYNSSGSQKIGEINVNIETTPPTISNVSVQTDEGGYTVTCNVSDTGSGLDKVVFPTWTVAGDQDDLAENWETGTAVLGTITNGRATFRVKRSDHNNEYGQYVTHIYAYDKCGNRTSVVVPTVKLEMTSGENRRLPDGDYLIVSAADPTYYLDISGRDTSAPNGTNVVLTGPLSNHPEAYDIWTLTYNDGFYSICQKNSNAALDVKDASTEIRANVQVWQKNSNSNQKWAITYFGEGKGYRIQSKCSGMSLDITGASIANNINIEQYTGNSSDAQRWLFVPYEPQKTIEEGRYILTTGNDRHVELDVHGDTANVADGTNIRIWNDKCPSKFNSFDVKYVGNGYYNLVHAASGKYMEVVGSSTDNCGNIQLWSSNSANNQKWCIIPQNSGYMLVNRTSGLVMDVQDGKTEDGTNVRQHYYNGSLAQTWFFEKAEYMVKYDANGGINAPAEQVKYYNEDLTLQEAMPDREGYKFLGWSDGNEASAVVSYATGGKYTENKDTTLYAVWEKLEEGLILPSSLTTVGEEAFEGAAFKYAVLPEGAESIEKRAFADCGNLRDIYIPESTVKIAEDAFEGVSGLTIHGKEGSYAEFYAEKHHYAFIPTE